MGNPKDNREDNPKDNRRGTNNNINKENKENNIYYCKIKKMFLLIK